MTDQNTTPPEAVERVAEAVHNVNPWWQMNGDPQWPDLPAEVKSNDYERATAAIAAHTAYLWERAMQPDVVEAAARTWFQSLGLTNADVEWDGDGGEGLTEDEYNKWESEPVDVEEFTSGRLWIELPRGGRFYYEDCKYLFGTTAALMLLLGPREGGARDAD